MKCPRCRENNPSYALFCLKCATPFPHLPGSAQAGDFQFVDRCGARPDDRRGAGGPADRRQ